MARWLILTQRQGTLQARNVRQALVHGRNVDEALTAAGHPPTRLTDRIEIGGDVRQGDRILIIENPVFRYLDPETHQATVAVDAFAEELG